MSNTRFIMSLSPLRSSLSAMSGVPIQAGEKNMHVGCLELEGEIKVRSPVDTGHLRARYESRVTRKGDTIIGRVGTNVPYAARQEFFGTAHVRPAIDASRPRLIRIIGANTLEEAIQQAS